MNTTHNALHKLMDQGQSPWIDNITRDMLSDGELKSLVAKGIVGLTSNPTIFDKAVQGSKLYQDDLQKLARQGKSREEIYENLILDDIRNAAKALRPVYDQTDGRDGYVSIEVAPTLAYQTEKTFSEAVRIFDFLGQPNILVKIPGTPEGIPAFQRAITKGINVNVTLVFSMENYRAVANAYIDALEQRAAAGQPIDRLASVASFFVSRVDTAVDKKLDELIGSTTNSARQGELRSLLGKAAVANAKLAYEAYQDIFSGPRWDKLSAKGAQTQRCLWASTSTKNPAYRDVMYVEELIGPDTVDTMPSATIDALLDHGRVKRTLDQNVEAAHAVLAALEDAGISMAGVTHQLQIDGVKLFSASFDELLETIDSKSSELVAVGR
jgi:transaldolase